MSGRRPLSPFCVIHASTLFAHEALAPLMSPLCASRVYMNMRSQYAARPVPTTDARAAVCPLAIPPTIWLDYAS